MANRNTLAVSKLEDFKEWLIADGWTICVPKGDFEVLRAIKFGKKYPLIVYKKLSDNLIHYTLLDRDIGVIKAFLKSRRDEK